MLIYALRTHERLDVLPVGQLREPRVRLVALHVHQPGLRDTNISIGMVQLVEFPDFVEQHAIGVRLLDLPPVCGNFKRPSIQGCRGLREVRLSGCGRLYLSEVVSEFGPLRGPRCRDRETRMVSTPIETRSAAFLLILSRDPCASPLSGFGR